MTRFVFAFLLLAPSAYAQSIPSPDATDPEPRKVLYQRETQIDFDAVELDAELVRPSLALNNERQSGAFHPLIHVREDFSAEMLRDAATVR